MESFALPKNALILKFYHCLCMNFQGNSLHQIILAEIFLCEMTVPEINYSPEIFDLQKLEATNTSSTVTILFVLLII